MKDKNLPERCPNCFRADGYTDIIEKTDYLTNEKYNYKTDAWFCNYCGGLVKWKKSENKTNEKTKN
jgi:hypothetical protein